MSSQTTTSKKNPGGPEDDGSTPTDRLPLLALGLAEGIGLRRLASLIAVFGSAEEVLRQSTTQLRSVPGIGPELARRIRRAGGQNGGAEARRADRLLRRMGVDLLTPRDPGYPEGFRRLDQPPYLLFALGDRSLVDRTGVAIVGTRNASVYGREVAARLARELAAAGIPVISGMARGIDAAAHRGALGVPGPTIGVLGHGIGHTYPPENRLLFRDVADHGLLLTEFLPFEKPLPGNFPRRNRLITALSGCVVVVEMSHQSGAQHTVGFALDQGVEVMAVPGPIGSPASEGTNQLIQQGAAMVTSVRDILDVVGHRRSAGAAAVPAECEPRPASATAPSDAILRVLTPEPTHIDRIAAAVGLPVTELLPRLLQMEIDGTVAGSAGMRFRRRIT